MKMINDGLHSIHVGQKIMGYKIFVGHRSKVFFKNYNKILNDYIKRCESSEVPTAYISLRMGIIQKIL